MCVGVDGVEYENGCMCVCVRVPTLCCGDCATSQGLLDWLEVDLSARSAFSYRVICVLSIVADVCWSPSPSLSTHMSPIEKISFAFPLIQSDLCIVYCYEMQRADGERDLAIFAQWLCWGSLLMMAAASRLFQLRGLFCEFCAVMVLRFVSSLNHEGSFAKEPACVYFAK